METGNQVMDDFQRELLARLPLAEAVLRLFAQAFAPPFLQELFAQHRGRCYQKVLSFDTLVYLTRDALLTYHGSAQQAFDHAREQERLPVAIQNAYAKLGRVPVEVATALLREGSRRLEALLPGEDHGPAAAVRLPASLGGLEVVAVDGKKLKKAAKRLKVLRGLPGKMLAGKLLVALDVRSGLALAMSADRDGERNDVPLVPALLPQVRGRVTGPILWVADRQFADLTLPGLFLGTQDHFLLRCTKNLSFHADGRRPAQEQTEPQGRRVVQEWGWIGAPKDRRRRYVRRITLYRPHEEAIILITDLLDERAYPAADLLEVYLHRWGIENMFQVVTEVFQLQRLIGSTPQAAIFQGALCLLLYDMVQVVKRYVAQAGRQEVANVSTEKLFGDVTAQLISWATVGEASRTCADLGAPLEAAALRAWLGQRLASVWTARWLKAEPKKNKPPVKTKVPQGHAGHSSVWKIIQQYQARRRHPTPVRS
jgi:hypothetical protein